MEVTEIIIQNVNVASSIELMEISNNTIGFDYVIEPSGKINSINDNTEYTSSIIDVAIIGKGINDNQKKSIDSLLAKLKYEIHTLESISIVEDGQLTDYQSN